MFADFDTLRPRPLQLPAAPTNLDGDTPRSRAVDGLIQGPQGGGLKPSDLTPIITPGTVQINSAHNITPATKDRTQQELCRACDIINSMSTTTPTMQIHSKLMLLLEPSDFFEQHTRCISFEIRTGSCERTSGKRWLALCESLLRHLPLDLETRLNLQPWTLQPFPERFALRASHPRLRRFRRMQCKMLRADRFSLCDEMCALLQEPRVRSRLA